MSITPNKMASQNATVPTRVPQGACGSERLQENSRRIIAWTPLLAIPTLTAVLLFQAPRWVFMWALAVSIYAGLKWLTFADTPERKSAPLTRQLGYLFLWCGMNARSFLAGPKATHTKPTLTQWLLAFAKVALGFALIYLAVPWMQRFGTLAAGWTGMVGIAFVLHFGLLHVLALCWQAAGYTAPPIMNKPHRSVSLGEFWGKRWNTAFRDLAHRYVFRPLVTGRGVVFATMAVFVASAFVHEIVITPSAGGGYGLPSIYFLLQGMALLAERSRFGKRLGLGRGPIGRAYCLIVIALPAVICFPPVFIERVTMPLMQAMGAI